MTFSQNLHLRYQSMQEIEMPEKCCFYPLEEELGRGALIKQKFNYLLSIRNFWRGKVHWHGQAAPAPGETRNDCFCAKIHTKYTLKVVDPLDPSKCLEIVSMNLENV